MSFLGNDLLAKYDIFCVTGFAQFEDAKTQQTPLTVAGSQYPPKVPPLGKKKGFW